MTDVLVLGGTGWLSGRIAERWADAGASVTCLARGGRAAPYGTALVVGDRMYLVTPFPNFVFALDLSRPGAPIAWRFDPKPLAAARGVACCDVVNRGAAYWNGLVIFNTLPCVLMKRRKVSVKSVMRYVNWATKKTGKTRPSPFGDSNHAGW